MSSPQIEPTSGNTTRYGDGTRSVRAGLPAPVPGEPFLPGPTFAAPYHLPPAGQDPDLDGYGRPDNRTVRRLEVAVGELEGGGCVAFASGMAAITGLLLAVPRPGDAVLIPADGYYSVRTFARDTLAGRGIEVREVATAGPYPDGVFDQSRLVLLESPSNPGLDVCDIADVTRRAHAAGALVAVDNTTATPLGQRPLDLGADIVVASGTKALTGHSDLLLGYAAARDPQLLTTMRTWRDGTGALPGPFEAWLAHRSLGTLDLRLARQTGNAAAVVALLAGRAEVTGLRWPGRPEDPAHALAATQMHRFPGVVTFQLPSAAHVTRFLEASRLVAAATSFGGLHTTADRRAQWGDTVPETLVRLSCGCEDTADLVADIEAALAAAGRH